jgi:hypothetical protein
MKVTKLIFFVYLTFIIDGNISVYIINKETFSFRFQVFIEQISRVTIQFEFNKKE